MIVPIGHSESGVRRLPWVTFGLMGVCVVVFLVSLRYAGQSPRLDRVERFVEYFFEHPYLELNDEQERLLRDILAEPGLSRDFDALVEVLKERAGPAPTDPRVVQQQQDELDRRFRELVAEIDRSVAGFYRSLGLIPNHLTAHGFVTHMFVHGGFWHLFFNLLFLYLAGPFVEDRWGRPVFASFYVFAGIVAALVYVLRYPESSIPLIGASGAIAGVMGAFLILFWNTKITFFYWLFFMFVGTFEAPSWLMLPLWFVREVVFAQASDVSDPTGSQGGTAFLAHVGGFAVGVAVASVFKHYRVEERYFHRAIEAKTVAIHHSNEAVDRAMEDASRGGVDRAVTGLRETLRTDPDNLDAAAALWGLEVGRGRATSALPVMLSAIRRAVRTGEEDFVVAHWDEIVREGGEAVGLGPADAVRVADALVRFGERASARHVIDHVMRPPDAATPDGVALRAARLSDELGSPRAPELARAMLLREDVLPPELRRELGRIAGTGGDVDTDPPSPPVAMETPVPLSVDGTTAFDEIAPPVELAAPRHRVEAVDAVPSRLIGDTLVIQAKGASRDLALRSVQAIAVAGIKPVEGRPFLLVDLLLDAPWSDREALRVVRLRSNAFDPRALVGGQEAVAAFRTLLRRLLEISEAVPLPDPEAAVGNPFRTFDTIASYQRAVLTDA